MDVSEQGGQEVGVSTGHRLLSSPKVQSHTPAWLLIKLPLVGKDHGLTSWGDSKV